MTGIIVDIKGSKAVVLTKNGVFNEIRNKNYVIGQKIKEFDIRRYTSLAACLVVFTAMAVGGYKFYHTPYSYVYIDINPSIRLDINYFDRVIDHKNLNDDAAKLEIKHGNVMESIEYLIEECDEKGFLSSENSEIEIGIMTGHDKLTENVYMICEKYKEYPYTVIINETTKDKSIKANEYDISVKKLDAIEKYAYVYEEALDDDIVKLKDLSVDEIIKLTEQELETYGNNSESVKENDVIIDDKTNSETNEKSVSASAAVNHNAIQYGREKSTSVISSNNKLLYSETERNSSTFDIFETNNKQDVTGKTSSSETEIKDSLVDSENSTENGGIKQSIPVSNTEIDEPEKVEIIGELENIEKQPDNKQDHSEKTESPERPQSSAESSVGDKQDNKNDTVDRPINGGEISGSDKTDKSTSNNGLGNNAAADNSSKPAESDKPNEKNEGGKTVVSDKTNGPNKADKSDRIGN